MPDTWTLLLGLIFSSIGLGYYIYGKKQSRPVVRYCGLALMLYPYLIADHFAVFAIGVVLMFLPRFVVL